MRKLVMVLGALVLTSAGLTPASASHPTWICIDAGPEDHTAVSNDDVVDLLTISVGASDDGHPPQQDGCVITEGGDAQGAVIHVEVTGAADDDGDTPSSPDRTCTVPAGSNHCSVEPPISGGGTQTLRAWLDIGEGTEIDRTEGPDEDIEPGELGEPDMTDVSEWMWTHVDPPPPCEDDQADCIKWPTDVTLRYRHGTFSGRVTSELSNCRRRRSVTVWRLREGPDELVASTHSGTRGWWSASVDDQKPGRYRAKVSKSAVPDGVCEKARSPRVRV